MHYFSNLFDKVLYMFRQSQTNKKTYQYRNTKEKLCKTNAAIRYKNMQRKTASTLLYIRQSSILTTLADANRTSMTNNYCVYKVLRYS